MYTQAVVYVLAFAYYVIALSEKIVAITRGANADFHIVVCVLGVLFYVVALTKK